MRDYRTWWMRGHKVRLEMAKIDFAIDVMDLIGGFADEDSYCCIQEQLWAIREGLADAPMPGRES